jgi:hypothetical protein
MDRAKLAHSGDWPLTLLAFLGLGGAARFLCRFLSFAHYSSSIFSITHTKDCYSLEYCQQKNDGTGQLVGVVLQSEQRTISEVCQDYAALH